MTGYLVRRVLQMAVTLALFLALVFLLVQAQPGDYTSFYTGDPRMSPESREAIAALFGVDRPAWQQFLVYLRNVARGDLGVSFGHYPRSVASVLAERLPRTVALFLTASVLSFYLGFVAGKAMAWRRGGALEHAATVGGVYLYTVFTPWFALVLIWLFALRLGWLPAGRFVTPELWLDAPVDSTAVFTWLLAGAGAVGAAALTAAWAAGRMGLRRPGAAALGAGAVGTGGVAAAWGASGLGGLAWDILTHMALPVLTLTLISFAGTMLLTRASMLGSLREGYVVAARARGLPEGVVRDRYAARNALLPVVTSLVLGLAAAVDGSVIIEAVFSWPGMGMTLVEAATEEDLPLAVGAFVVTGVFVLLAHLAADLLYAYLDPRVRAR